MSGEKSSDALQASKNRIRLLTDELREELKKPQGLLIEGPFQDAMKRLKELVEIVKPSLVVSVGDIVSSHMVEEGISFDVLLVDNKTMRKPIQPIVVDVDQTLYANNPPGTITEEAWATIRQAIEQKGITKVLIDGEEDLLTVVTVLSAPDNAFVVYGQPHVGIVVVKVTTEAKEKMQRILDSMDNSSKS
ncbi:MAG: DUF359 domain-containing protein [Candidatus Bathyarchaeota archaeon]|jgi:hypothetical protein